MIMKTAKILHLRGVCIYEQLRFEELLLRNTVDNYIILNHHIPQDSIVLGLSGKPHELLNTDALAKRRIPVIRRYTGGGTVVVDENTAFVTLIMNSKDVPCLPYPRDIMKWTTDQFYHPLFASLAQKKHTNGGLDNDHIVSATSTTNDNDGDDDDEDEANKFALRENDYVWDNRKIGGNAQTIIKDRWVHHTSFLWRYDVDKMSYLQLPRKRPEYRDSRPHHSFLAEVATIFPHITISDFFQRTCDQYGQLFNTTRLKDYGQVIEKSEFQSLDSDYRSRYPSFVPRTVYLCDDEIIKT